MVRRPKLKTPSLVLLAALLSIGGLSLGLGLQGLVNLRSLYREEDIAYSESPQTFRLWFLRAQQGQAFKEEVAKAVASRLSIMRLDQRRALVHALMGDRYLDSLSTDNKRRRASVDGLLQGVLNALSTSPLSGDLWLVAARLRRRLNGFDETAAHYLEASFRYAPREEFLALDRLVLSSQVSPLLSDEVKELAKRDGVLVRSSSDQHVVERAQELHRAQFIADE
jgi:hypothetical protein